MIVADWAGVIFAADATMKIGARLATNMAITCCRPNGTPFQKDTGASSEDNASNDMEFLVFFSDMILFSLFPFCLLPLAGAGGVAD